MSDKFADAPEGDIGQTPEEARIRKLEERMNDMVDVRELSSLVSRWRSRAEIFGEDDEVAKRTARLCADELEELIEDG